MEIAALKSFATSARTVLIREVSARIAVVLSSASTEWIERPTAVSALEGAIKAAGGGETGRAAVADRVAYTWFNRMVALRFMDANGYTGIGVVSPAHGHVSGQPEILAEAKRGNIDAQVVDASTADIVAGLLNGTSRSDDPQGEAYGLLLAEYCRYWNRSMPFMFEREGDYTELLIPSDLLADSSVMACAVKVLTAEVCQDVEVIGWLYQFYVSERKDEVFAGFKRNQKAGAAEIPAATQLFTPHWIVRYLIENSLGRLWLLNRPTSKLAEQMDYYIAPVDEETDFLKVSSPEELRVIDPACGSGHMLTYAFDLLYAIYEEEGYAPASIPALILTNNLYGTEIDPRAGSLAAFALTMKARAKQRTIFRNDIVPNVRVLEPVRFEPDELDHLCRPGGNRAEEEKFWNQFEHADVFGALVRPHESLITPLKQHLLLNQPADLFAKDLHNRANGVLEQAEYLSQRYHIIIANPPYMGSGNMNSMLSDFARRVYPDSKSDLMTMFMSRMSSLALAGAFWGMINLTSWMFLTTFDSFRASLLPSTTIRSMLHLGRGVFGSDFGSVAFVVQARRPTGKDLGQYRRLFTNHVDVRANAEIEALFHERNFGSFTQAQATYALIPGHPIAYWLSPAATDAFRANPRIDSIVAPRKGITTADDAQFLRRWYEVSNHRLAMGVRSMGEARASRKRWFPCNKGGAFRRWYGNQDYVVNWEADGHALKNFTDRFGRQRSTLRNLPSQFDELVSWSDVSSGAPSFRLYPTGFIFNDVGNSFPVGGMTEKWAIMGLLNSVIGTEFLKVLSPNIHFSVGQVAAFPVRGLSGFPHTAEVMAAVRIAHQDWISRDTSFGFERAPLLDSPGEGIVDKMKALQESEHDETIGLQRIEQTVNRYFIDTYGFQDSLSAAVPLDQVSLFANDEPKKRAREILVEFISYAVGCMFGRYSLDAPGLLLASQGEKLQDYIARIPTPSFMPDADNVIPIVEGDWFEDDIVARFRQFLRVAFGEEHFEGNLRFVTESLEVNDLRDYFVKSFYKDHVQRYKKRPIYWLFSSPKGSFNALIYMHRYTPSTVSTVLNEYLREFKAKLEASLQHEERLGLNPEATPRGRALAQKKAESLRKTLLELDGYEHDVLYPLATQQIVIDLDDGVKVNYPKFGAALKKIAGLEATND